MSKTAIDRANFNEWCAGEHPYSISYDARGNIWQYFAPHLKGEFPREAIRQQLLTDLIECLGGQNLPPTNQTNRIRAWVMADHLERPWNGEPAKECSFCLGTGKCQGGDACHRGITHDCLFCSGTGCPTCEGSGEVPVIMGHQCNIFPCYHDRKPCPDCKEKPQKCLRCGYMAGTLIPVPAEFCGHTYVDQRKGQQKQNSGRRIKNRRKE